jgi:hypothetical protein
MIHERSARVEGDRAVEARGGGVISIMTTTYDRSATLPRSIDSVFARAMTDWELVIVDDGSQVETLQGLSRYVDSRLHAVDRGVTAACNTRSDTTTGEWFPLPDSDDEPVPGALEVLMDTATRTGAEAITCDCAVSQTGSRPGHVLDEEGYKRLDELKQTSGQHWGLTKTSLLNGLRFDERLPGLKGVLWSKIAVRARLGCHPHRALGISHTEGEQRVTRQARRRSLAEQCQIDLVPADDGACREALAMSNPGTRRRLLRRGRSARLLLGSRFLSIPGVCDMWRRHFYALVAAVGFMRGGGCGVLGMSLEGRQVTSGAGRDARLPRGRTSDG